MPAERQVDGGKIGVPDWSVEPVAVGRPNGVVFWRETGGPASFVEFVATFLTKLLMVVRLTFGLRTTYHLPTVVGIPTVKIVTTIGQALLTTQTHPFNGPFPGILR